MRLSIFSFCMALAVAFLAGCSKSTMLPTVNENQQELSRGLVPPRWSAYATVIPSEPLRYGAFASLPSLEESGDAAKAAGGIYASEVYGSDIFGYPANNGHNGRPMCAETNVSAANGIAIDGKGDLMDPDGGSHSIIVFKGPKMCGARLGSANDPYGQPSDAASANAATGAIVVANIYDNNHKPGSISRCTLARGCTSNIKSASMYEVAGVALAKNGDCWASATNSKGKATLNYFKGCNAPAHLASGYRNPYYGGLDIDKSGNLVALSYYDKTLYVYNGCNPQCTLVGGPFKLHGQAAFGHLNATSTKLVTGDYEYGQIDVYGYAATKLKYAYRFNKGLSASLLVEGAAYNPRSPE
jgi:hypothetical protein